MVIKKKGFRNTLLEQVKNKFIDLMALIVAIAAVVISMLQGSTQNKLEVVNKQPLLNIELIKADSEPEKGFLLKNVGFGPAIIKSFKYYKNEADYKNNINHIEWLDSTNNSIVVLLEFVFEDINFLNEGYIVTTNPQEFLYLLGTKHTSFYNSRTAKSLENVIIEIEYKSISPFDDKVYYLKFCENFIQNNIRDREKKNIYE